MSVLDTLEVLIEADASGLESQLKAASNNIQSFVNKMNGENVDWKKILSSTIDTSLISGIAATFATAIASAVSFQNAISTAGANSQQAFNDTSGQMTTAALAISNGTGQSAADTAAALGSLTQLFGSDTPTAIAATTEASKLATITGIALGDVVKMLIPIFDNWGIDTVPGVTKAVDDLYTASKNGKIPLSELAATLSGAGTDLRGHTSFQDAATGIEAISMQAGITKNDVTTAFNAISTGATDTLSNINILSGGVGSIAKALDAKGIIGAFELISKGIQNTSIPLGEYAKQIGLSQTATKDLGNQTVKSYAQSAAAQQSVIANEKDLNSYLDDSMTLTKELGILWTQIFNFLGKALGDINKDIGGFLAKLLGDQNWKDFIGTLGGSMGPSSTKASTASGLQNVKAGIGQADPKVNLNPNQNITNNYTSNYNVSSATPVSGNLAGGSSQTAYKASFGY